MIDLNAVTVLASNPACLSFPVTASLTHFGITPNDMQIRTSGTDSWPEVPVPPYTDPSQAGTLWVFRQIGGKWYAAGAERLRHVQLNGSKRVAEPQYGGLETLIGNGWFGKPDFGLLAGNNPIPGEAVGFCVVAGLSRLGFNCPVQARTEVIVCEWPTAGGAQPLRILWREGESVPSAPEPPPVSEPPTPVPAPPAPVLDAGILKALTDVVKLLEQIRDSQKALLEVWK